MCGNARVLIVGPTSMSDAVARAMPRCRPTRVEHPLAAVWKLGHEPFDGVFLSLSSGQNPERAVRSMRQLREDIRIVLSCGAADEPSAHRLLQVGADDYVLEPLAEEDLCRAFAVDSDTDEVASDPRPSDASPVSPEPPASPGAPASASNSPEGSSGSAEQVRIIDVLKDLGAGPQPVLERLAGLIRQTFDTRHVRISVDGLDARAGEHDDLVLREPIMRGGREVGELSLGHARRGSYHASTAIRLSDYARLIEAVVTLAVERDGASDQDLVDDLTKLPDRRCFEQRLSELLADAARSRGRLTLLILDIDGFKTYNQKLGHDAGDGLLREVARLFTRCTRETDVVARLGSDEFAFLLWDAEPPRIPGSQHPTEPVALAERFCRAIESHHFDCLGSDAPGPVTITGGLACYPWDGHTPEALLRAADQALLDAKQTGKKRILLAGAHFGEWCEPSSSPPASEPDPTVDFEGW